MFEPFVTPFPEEEEDDSEGKDSDPLNRNLNRDEIEDKLPGNDEETPICCHLKDVDDGDEGDLPVPRSGDRPEAGEDRLSGGEGVSCDPIGEGKLVDECNCKDPEECITGV